MTPGDGGTWPSKAPDFSRVPLVQRDRLVSAMLADRGVVRLLRAPSGFGKTALAYEYAQRLFCADDVRWVDARDPRFLSLLDGGVPEDMLQGVHPALVVFDDVPYLDEQRAAAMSDFLDLLTGEGVEVLVTLLPSCDSLSSRQGSCLQIRARDLLVAESECGGDAASPAPEARARRAVVWKHAVETACGRVPACFWGDGAAGVRRCIQGFFSEDIPASMRRCALVLLIAGSGDVSMLDRVGIDLRADELLILAEEYPFLGIDAAKRTFSAGDVPVACLDAASFSRLLLGPDGGESPVLHRLLRVLVERGRDRRVAEVLDAFCSDGVCAGWLGENGWDLLDAGAYDLVEGLMSRAFRDAEGVSAELLAMRAWLSGLTGDAREAGYYAQQVLGHTRPRRDPGEGLAMAASYLALLCFQQGGPLVCGKPDAPDMVDHADARSVVSALVGLCDEVELARAFCIGDAEREQVLQAQRSAPDAARARALVDLATLSQGALGSTTAFGILLHVLHHVDDVEVRETARRLSTAEVAASRGRGPCRASEAMLVCDLWKQGHFGAPGRPASARDGRLLDKAAAALERLGHAAADGRVPVPWQEATASVRVRADGPDSPGADVRQLHVRMFGCFEVLVEDRVLVESDWRRKARLLFALIVLQHGRDVGRDALLEQLWPRTARTRALDSFYTLWAYIRNLLGSESYLERAGEFCRVNPHAVWTDTAEFERLHRHLLTGCSDARSLLDVHARIESVYRGSLLPSERGNAFVSARRERYHGMYTDAMVAGAERSLDAGDARVSLWFARKAMEADRGREDVYHALIRAQIAAGQRCSAIRTYFQCRDYLRAELGLEPSSETQGLYDRLITVDPALMRLDPASPE